MRIKEYYKKDVLPKLKKKFDYKNNLEVPKIQKIVINTSFGKRNKEKEYIKNVIENITLVAGQRAVPTKAKKSISAFKVREGMIIGAKVTLRGSKMYDFFEKLINISFPRVRDFRGISPKCVDRAGNISIGFKDNFAFPENDVQDLDKAYGLEVNIHTSAKSKEEGFELLNLFNFPFVKK